ncbi:MAG: PAS domain S-box protein, partial [bacterium]|nr:PAS domain S-box protein [bacterium]
MGVFNPRIERYSWIRINAVPQFHPGDSNPFQVYTTFEDITSQKLAEKELLQKQHSLNKAQEIGCVGAWELDLTRNILTWTDETYKIFGIPVNTPLTFELFLDCVHPDDRDYVNRQWVAALKQVPYDIEHRIIVDGKVKWAREKAELVFDNNGNAVEGIGFVQDISSRKLAEEEADNLANIIRQLSDIIVLTDLEGNITYVNPMFEKVYNYSLEEVMGKNPRFLHSEKAHYPPDFYENLWLTIRNDRVWHGEFTNKTKSGVVVIEDAAIFPFKDLKTGKSTGYGAVKKDITRRKHLENQLKESYDQLVLLKEKAEAANRLKSQFLANMSHDIRTPLNAVIGFTDLLSKKKMPKESMGYLNRIKTAGEGLVNLIDDILDFSKIEVGQLDICLGTFRLKKLLEDIKSIFEIQFQSRAVAFDIRISPGVPGAFYNDKWRINQVLTNLLSNALKFTASGSVVLSIDYMSKPDRMVFNVTDTGIGIAEHHLESIFNPFSQPGTAGDFTHKGSGLGLAICSKLVQLMGGTISVSS